MKDIPKLIHFIWVGGELPDKLAVNPSKWAQLNPGWEIVRWGDEEIEALIKESFPKYWPIYSKLDKPIKKADFARLIVIYKFGGVYIDYDLIPLSPLDNLLSATSIYNTNWAPRAPLPDKHAETFIDMDNYSIILSKEHCRIDDVGVGIANGVILSQPNLIFWLEFLEQQLHCYNGLVLDFVGTWALTRFVRANIDRLGASGSECRTLALPPHYFLWEPRFYKADPPFYSLSIHLAENTWGDPTKKDYFKV